MNVEINIMSYINLITHTGKKYRINDAHEIARGGEGCIYEIDGKTVAKIYHPGIQPIQQKKFDFLNKLDKNLFIAPQDILLDSKSKVVGFTMEYLGQDYFPLSSIFTKSFCDSHGIDKKMKVEIIEKLIYAVEYAHKNQIVIGDFNCFNIMVNSSGSVKFIDTDSYQTPGFVHSGRLLDEIRDYYYQGRVNENSDYFALSVLAFNLLTYTHPFKGVHKKYLKISDRMVHKIPVFANDPDLKVPKCYEPISDNNLMRQFERMYLNTERFLLSIANINANYIVITVNQPSLVKKYEQDDLIITYVSGDQEKIKKIFATENRLVIETAKDFLIYDVSIKGVVSFTDRIEKSEYDKVFIGNKNILAKKGKELYVYLGKGIFKKNESIVFPDKAIYSQHESIIHIISVDTMYKIFIDECFGSHVRYTSTPVYGKGFKNYRGLIWNSGGKHNVFYNFRDKDTSIIQMPFLIEGVVQNKNMGIVQYKENNEIKQKFFKIKGGKLNMAQNELSSITNFAYKETKDEEGFIFMPSDDSIKVLRTQDFAEISEIKCNLISSESTIFNTNAGILLFDSGKVWLLNKK